MRLTKQWKQRYEQEQCKAILATGGTKEDPIPKCTCENCKDEPVCPYAWDLYNQNGECLAWK